MTHDVKPLQGLPPLFVPALAAILMYATVLFAPQVLNDADTFWHIAAGERMIETGKVIHTDPFSHTMPGVEWQTHEWFSEILMGGAFKLLGWNGVVMLGALAAAAAAALIGGWLARFTPPLTAMVTVILGLTSLMSSLLVRPHLLAMPIMALWVIAILLAREKDRGPPWWLLAVMIVWANLHGSYVFGLALLGPFALEALIAAPARWRAVVLHWGSFGVLALGAALITPHGIGGLIHPFQLMTMTSLPDIVEWRPLDFSKALAFEAALLATLFVAFYRGMRVPVVRLLVLLLLLHMALQHTRHLVVLGVVGPLLLAQPLGEALEPTFKPEFRRRMRPVLAVALAAAVALTSARMIWPLVRTNGYHAPITALAAVPADLREKPVLNSYGLGGYLIFEGVDVFIDGRADMYGDAFTNRFVRLAQGHDAEVDKAIEEFDIEWVFIDTNAKLVRAMEGKDGWRRLHRDDVATVYVRDDYEVSVSEPSSTSR